MESSGNFDTGELKIVINGEKMLDLCRCELNQTSERFQSGLKKEFEAAIKKAYTAGYTMASVVLQQAYPSII